MQKLGFRQYGKTWQHKQLIKLQFIENPSWESSEKTFKYVKEAEMRLAKTGLEIEEMGLHCALCGLLVEYLTGNF
jgi:hypothetical protein